MPRSARVALLICASLFLLCACGKRDNAPVDPISKHAASTAATAHPPAAHTAAPKPAPVAVTKATPARPATVTAPAAASTTFKVAGLTLGNAIDATYAVTQPATRFADDTPTIFASVASSGRTERATLDARWSYLEGKPLVISDISQPIAADGPAVTTFKVHNPNLWPQGKYKVDISLDGKPVASQDFEIGKR